MSREYTGSVVTQQTILGFSNHPPSPFGAANLPQCITEQRGGQPSFAMNRHTQLQFNLGIPPHPTNLATHFNSSHPTPVMIEKPSFGLHGGAFSTVSSKKLALAIRLAKRDLRLGQLQLSMPASPQLCPCCRNERSVPSTVHCERSTVDVPEPPTPVKTDAGCSETKVVVRDSENPLPQRTPNHSAKQPVPQAELSSLLMNKEGNQRREDRSSQEVLRLRKELQKQVAYIKQLRELGCGLGHMMSTRQDNNKRGRRRVRGGRVVESGRVWMEKVRGEEEKLLQREEEQAARNARSIYNLSHQLSRLQQDLQKLQLNESANDSTKKSQALRRLATIYRSALRLLQNYQSPGHTPQPLPPELALLLQQLSLISHHFGVGGAKSELDATIRLLQELIEQEKENDCVIRQAVKKKNTESRKPVVQKQNRVNRTKKTSGLFHPQLVSRSVRGRRGWAGQPHFAQQTLSSQRRQQPKQTVHSPLKHSPALLHSSTPFAVQSEAQKERYYRPVQQSAEIRQAEPPLNAGLLSPLPDTHMITPKQGKANSCPAPSLQTNASSDISSSAINRQSVSASAPSVVTDGKRTAKIALCSPVDGHTVAGTDDTASPAAVMDEQRLWMEGISATLAHHSQQLEMFKRTTDQQLGQLQQNLYSQRKAEKKKEGMSQSPVERVSGENQQLEESAAAYYDGKKLEELMERLRELEGEEEIIRERWCTIAYEDPPLAKPPVLHCNEEQSLSSSVCPPPAIPEEALQRITSYRQRFQHHLQMTGHNTQGGFNPWNMAEKIADELLSEVVEQVAEELGELCDGYVDGLFSNEFARPPTPTLSSDSLNPD